MKVSRRAFITTASAMVAGMATTKLAASQESQPASKAPPVPTRQAKVERLFKAPDSHPNALEAAPDGLWIGDQVSERIFRSEEHTSELQSQSNLVCRLLLEKKKK